MPTENNTNPPALQATLERAQEHASQLLRAAHDCAQAIDAALRLQAAGDPVSARLQRMRAYGAAQDAKVLARRFLDRLAGVEPASLVRERITVGVFRSRCFGDHELLSDCASELARDVAMEVVAMADGNTRHVPTLAFAPGMYIPCRACDGRFPTVDAYFAHECVGLGGAE